MTVCYTALKYQTRFVVQVLYKYWKMCYLAYVSRRSFQHQFHKLNVISQLLQASCNQLVTVSQLSPIHLSAHQDKTLLA